MASSSKLASPRSEPNCNWLELPPELMALILQRVGTVDVLENARRVCKMWWRIIWTDPSVWRVVKIRAPQSYIRNLRVESEFEKMAFQAVDLSCGQLIEFNIENFGSDDLMHYVGERSSQIRRLCLKSCRGITATGFSIIFKRLPLLEELDLDSIGESEEAIKVAGRCCPQLKSLQLRTDPSDYLNFKADEEALAIAENMHGLRHLQLFGNLMTSVGLVAILDNCRQLESLDVRGWYGDAAVLSLFCIPGRLYQRAKHLRLVKDH